MRNPVRAVAAAALVAGPTVIAFSSGGFFERPRLIAGIAAWALVVLATVVARRPLPRSKAGRVAIGGLAGLAAWTALSIGWAPIGQRALEDTQRLVLYVAVLVAAVALLRGRVARRALEPTVAAGGLVVALYALAERLVPSLVEFERSRSGQGRLEQPLTYWNALGCLCAMCALLCIRVAADARRSRVERAAAGAAGVPLGLAMYLTFSRGALFAFGVGVVVLLALAPSLRGQARAAVAVVGPAALAAVVAELLPTVSSLPMGAQGDTTQGLVMLGALVGLATVAGLLAAATPASEGTVPRRAARLRPATAAAAIVLVLAGGLAAVAALETSPRARSAGDPTGAGRFTSADSTRYAFWGVVLDSFAAHPLRGDGSGSFAVEWRRQPDRTEEAVDAHSLYLETLGELGLVGAALLVLFLAGAAAAAGRIYGREPAAAAGVIAAVTVWAVHAGLDWDWEMPAVTGVALVLMGALIAWDDDPLPA